MGDDSKTVDWYFDPISPYAYLQLFRLPEISNSARIRYRPLLFAGLLNHWGQLGPAEIAPKRLFTYRHVTWLAKRAGIELVMPSAHPFNPLPLLRLAALGGDDHELIRACFEYVWRDGHIPEERVAFDAFLDRCGIDGAAERIESTEAKRAVIENGERALKLGVFGVPTLAVDGQLFWGNDATDMLCDWLANPAAFDDEALKELPSAARRL